MLAFVGMAGSGTIVPKHVLTNNTVLNAIWNVIVNTTLPVTQVRKINVNTTFLGILVRKVNVNTTLLVVQVRK